MGTHKQNKISMDVAADSSSPDSLSFTSLVCIDQNQQSKSLTGRSSSAYDQNNKDNDHEFEFKNPHNSNKNSYPDKVISGGHLRPLEFSLKSAQPQAADKLGLKKSRMVSQKSNEEAKNQVKREATGSNSWFGRKLFRSFVSPCRECRAVKPTKKAPAAPRERIKLH